MPYGHRNAQNEITGLTRSPVSNLDKLVRSPANRNKGSATMDVESSKGCCSYPAQAVMQRVGFDIEAVRRARNSIGDGDSTIARFKQRFGIQAGDFGEPDRPVVPLQIVVVDDAAAISQEMARTVS